MTRSALCKLSWLAPLLLILLLPLTSCSNDSGDPTGPSDPYAAVDLSVPVITQQRPNWCWLAAAQMVIAYRNYNQSLQQCSMLEVGYQTYPGTCCLNPYACDVPGTTFQIQYLVAFVGGRYSAIATTADPLTLAATLRQGSPVVAFLRSPYQAVGHFVVIRGIRFDSARNAYLRVNDPMSYLPGEVSFGQFYQLWGQSLVVY